MNPTLKITPDAAKRIVEAGNAEQLQVKELASALQVSKRYVYEMRACGFVMVGKNNYTQTASEADARRWIADNHFRMVQGRGVKSSGVGGKS